MCDTSHRHTPLTRQHQQLSRRGPRGLEYGVVIRARLGIGAGRHAPVGQDHNVGKGR